MTFEEIKKDFYAKAGDLSLFEGTKANYLKVALDGIKVNYQKQGAFKTPIFDNIFAFRLRNILKRSISFFSDQRKQYKKHLTMAKKNQNPDVFLLDPGRSSKNEFGEYVSFYFHKLYNEFGDRNIFFASEKKIENYALHQDSYNDKAYYAPLTLSQQSKDVLKDIKKVYQNIKKQGYFSDPDLTNIRLAFQVFFNQYLYWSPIFKYLSPKELHFICHYHKEGMIMAAKQQNIKLIEYQHGLIAKSDIFYDFPKGIISFREKMLFADQIKVYGQFWKDKIISGHAYSDLQIELKGFYQYECTSFPSNIREEFHSDNFDHIFLITTQTYLAEAFIEYTQFLLNHIHEHKLKILIIVKIHPSEDLNIYTENLSPNPNLIITKELALAPLLKTSDLNITIYSTTVYDALRHNTPSVLLNHSKCRDYVFELHQDSQSPIIELKQFPNLDFNQKTLTVDHFFS
ncbi:hypothetical protein PQO03_20490 [Lentisphaera profundi]|uniref:Capsule biosynthesis protein n=1 Tax=Lentisphaera profundi TaxID=1658616 RepID=A0ABY7VZQ1_9BACT|nr:hypothetical protein [Lentisphaera profundi]WDE98199.1 hypothetical protein PQO03_20490 [Lentisphaera profundi]